VTQIGQEEAARIEMAFREAQSRTSGRIVCVLARASSTYEMLPLVWSALVALLAPWPLLVFTEISAERIYLYQFAAFIAVLVTLSLPRLRPMLTPAAIRRASAHHAALEQFALRGLSHGPERNGVLIYVSVAEHFARIIADEGAAKVIHQREWQAIVDQLLSDMRERGTEDALTGVGARCADLLGRHFPPKDGAARPPFHSLHVI
jgi:putative membrane protein